MADVRLTAELKAQVNLHTDDTLAGVLTRWTRIAEILLQAGIAYKAPNVSVWDVMVHPSNRNGLGLNQHEVHSILAGVKDIGCDLHKLEQSTAFECANAAALEFNQKLIDAAAGLLAPLRKSERLCSVASSHFTAGCRASLHGCRTEEQDLKDANGNINHVALCDKDDNFKKILSEGWTWTVFPRVVEEEWPMLPAMAQEALNADQAIASEVSELQVMCNMAAQAESMGDAISWSDVVRSIKASRPPCHSYVEVADLHTLYKQLTTQGRRPSCHSYVEVADLCTVFYNY